MTRVERDFIAQIVLDKPKASRKATKESLQRSLEAYYHISVSSIGTWMTQLSAALKKEEQGGEEEGGGGGRKPWQLVDHVGLVWVAQQMADAERTLSESAVKALLHEAQRATAERKGLSREVRPMSKTSEANYMQVVGGFADSTQKSQWDTKSRKAASERRHLVSPLHASFFGRTVITTPSLAHPPDHCRMAVSTTTRPATQSGTD